MVPISAAKFCMVPIDSIQINNTIINHISYATHLFTL